ncbi:MAG: magnesium transporter [Candidatus Xenobium sp.]|jgi:magnesium transporter|nr:magnesium transporter [Burkholderiales bacterium]
MTTPEMQFERAFYDWPRLDTEERLAAFRSLPLERAEELLDCMNAVDQADLLLTMSKHERRAWLRYLDPDDLADVMQEVPSEDCQVLLDLLDVRTRNEVRALMAYAEDDAGGLMSPRFARVRAQMTADEAIRYLRAQSQRRIPLESLYVLDSDQKLLGEVGLNRLFSARPDEKVADLMDTDLVTAPEDMDQEEVGALFSRYDLTVMPVVDDQGRMKGLITVDDVMDVLQEEATEDAQKYGGMEALDEPYLRTGILNLIKKRVGWLTLLLMAQMLTAWAMARYEDELSRALVLAIFVPLIISSGGNSGSQASTLVIRAMAMGEVRLRDWPYVLLRELGSGLILGSILGIVGFGRIVFWEYFFHVYGPHYLALAGTVALSLLGVVLLGCVAGSMLPFILRFLKFDPASASAPFVATLVDVSGLILYFTVASILLTGTLL